MPEITFWGGRNRWKSSLKQKQKTSIAKGRSEKWQKTEPTVF